MRASWAPAVLWGASLAAGAQAATVHDPTCGVLAIVQRSETVVYPLARGFLREGSDSLWSASRLFVRGEDYVLERTRGTLRLRVSPVPGETLWVRVCGLLEPPPRETRFLTYRPAQTSSDSAAGDSALDAPPVPRPSALRSTSEAPIGAALAIHGNKTLAVDFGSNQDAFLRQSLDLSVGGALAPGVELTGVLSDRNTPLTAAGSTRDLQSLDRLLLELKAPRGGAALGDVTLALDQGEFGRIERRLQGVRGEWSQGDLHGVAAAASAEGEFHRMQFYGVEGRQGPYVLSGRDGVTSVAVVPGSEVVTLDGERLVRGESADYALDYERAQLTFTNRRPIGAASRITVDYQIAVNRFRRNLAAAAARWTHGPWRLSTTMLTEGDDRGRPLASALAADDRLALASAGDSAALGGGVSGGGGDYDLAADSTGSRYVYAGPDSGDYVVSFARVGQDQGDYVDSVLATGRLAYRFVGPGRGTHRVGRMLPSPDSHQLWSMGGAARLGAVEIEVEGALSRQDRNTFSALDDADNLGRAGTARLAVEGRAPWRLGVGGIVASSRTIERRFAPFGRLERPFAQEDWGLPVGAELERQTRHEGAAFIRPLGGELRGSMGRLETVDGFRSWRRSLQWDRAQTLVTRARWERADGEEAGRVFPEGGRERKGGAIGLRLDWIQPLVRADWDERWTPADSGRSGERSRELAAEVASGTRFAWRMSAGLSVRRDGRLEARGYRDLHEVRAGRWSLQTPEGSPWGAQVQWQHRVLSPLAVPGRTVSDLASARLRAADAARGWSAAIGLEVTSEAESERLRAVRFVGAEQGAYDSLGNFLGAGNGDYTLELTVGGALQRIGRAAGSVRLGWQPPLAGAWQGTRAELSLETDARRRGTLRGADAVLTPGTALGDGDLSRGAVTQRLEAEILPHAALGSLRLRLERRVSADRSFVNFSQEQDERSGSLRVSARPGAGWTAEVEGRMKLQSAAQEAAGGGAFARAVREDGVLARIGWSPSARLRGALVSDLAWAREQDAATEEGARTWRFGPEVGVSVLAHGRLELSARRTLTGGVPVGPVLPLPDFGVPRWESSARFDYRLRDQTTIAFSLNSREREARTPEHVGRAEVRAFF